ncbi:amidase signature domain-containing protein [Stachybotrys elegans]|uniref:Amidase signature domain-containing protein n=1 Tax=Stachybotrys elegans TaxID=80388 RepID=A0A8K0WUI7_9HYPO|nr:amidase signature domain-containing protein [Stachybotrys elegans]
MAMHIPMSESLWLGSALSIVEATIEELQQALQQGRINAVQLAAKHLHRVARYDRRGPRLNSIPVINTDVFELAQASDNHRAASGTIRSELEGIPVSLKDSYMVEGMTVASGSPAFKDLTARTDAFTTGLIRSGGGIILGKTNMPPMANGGMQRGVYGRADSPYSQDYLTAAYASGSSNGAGTSTSSSMSVIGMAEETVSSGRSPASNNGLVAYTPSRGVLSIRGNWPLFPLADVVVPYTRTIRDLLSLLDVIVQEDEDTTCDFWRGQPFISLPRASEMRPPEGYKSLAVQATLAGKRIGVPRMYIGEKDPAAVPVWVSPSVIELWSKARTTLESLGATVEDVDFPLVTESEVPSEAAWETKYPLPGSRPELPGFGPPELAAYAMDDFLAMVNDQSVSGITSLAQVDGEAIFPQLPGTLADRYGNRFRDRALNNSSWVDMAKHRSGLSIYSVPGVKEALEAVEKHRKRYLEDWMTERGLDAVVFPAAGDVGRQDVETNNESAVHGWRNGVFFSNGNYAIRQYGIPTVTVPMGLLKGSGMPMGLTFASRAYDDNSLLSYAYAFEKAHAKRIPPPRTPALPTDQIPSVATREILGTRPPRMDIWAKKLGDGRIEISGKVDSSASGLLSSVEVFVDGVETGPVTVDGSGGWSLVSKVVPYDDAGGELGIRFVNTPDQALAMVIAIANAENGRSDGKMLFA